ncbi:serine/threonine protein kinase [Egbenema bharatensis]|uniref:serine/threonine protein kinase n=1 Tax=Egbenema bharatensis TaxID=3463334 RepID=UPI003A89DF2D
MTNAIGKYLQNGKYTLDQELGQGGFGITYLAHHNTLGHIVVIKTLNDSLRQDPKFWEFQRQFQDEARRLAKFSHPNIVRVTDFFVEEELPYIVMDFIPGQTLKTLVIPNNPLPESVAIQYIQQIANALKVVHYHGLLHRDVKPQNVILRQGTQEVVLIDFGIAREFTPGQTQTHTGVLSVGYAPIEQYLPRAKRTPATDVYGLAATLYTLLTAEVPVPATLRHRQPLPTPRDLRPELSPLINQAVLHGMAVEPEQRPASVDEWMALLPNLQTSSTQGPAPHSYTSPATNAPTLAVSPPPPPHLAPEPPFTPRRVASEPPGGQRSAAPVPASDPSSDPPRSNFNDRPWLIAALTSLGVLGAIVLGNALLRPQSPSPRPEAPRPEAPSPTAPRSPRPDAPPAPIEEVQPTPEPSPTPEESPTPEAETEGELEETPEEELEPTLPPEAPEPPLPEEPIDSPEVVPSPNLLLPDTPSPIESPNAITPPTSTPSPEPQATVDAPPESIPVMPEEVRGSDRGRERGRGSEQADSNRGRGRGN